MNTSKEFLATDNKANEKLKSERIDGKLLKSVIFICMLSLLAIVSSCFAGREHHGRHHETIIIEKHDGGEHH